ncbi:sugar phosphate isomerase/epimerase family protein [Thermomicrobium sp.]
MSEDAVANRFRLMGWKLAAFADEIHPDPALALHTMQAAGINTVELRSAWGKNVLDLTDEELAALAQEVDQRRMTVAVIASPIGKSSIAEPAAFEMARLERALAIAHRLGSKAIRVFSFYLPSGESPERYRDEVLRRIQQWVRRAGESRMTLLHENDKALYGDVPQRCFDLLNSIGSPWFRAVWDPANFVQCGVRPFSTGFSMLAPFIAHVHVKDAVLGSGEVTVAGAGDGELADTLAALAARGYRGYLSLEPHLLLAGSHGGFTGRTAFLTALRALRQLLAGLPAPS